MTEQEEFGTIYNLDIIEIPTNRPNAREDHPDVVYKTEAGKYRAVIAQVKECHEKGQPVLVGTVSIEKNETLSRLLTHEGIQHNLLNAKNHEKEAEIVAQAGKFGAVTVATNMLYQFSSHEIQLITADLTGTDPVSAVGSVSFYDADTTILQYVGFNTSGVFADVALRSALNLGVNRAGIVSAFLAGHVVRPQILLTADPALTLSRADEDMTDSVLLRAGIPPHGNYLCFALRRWKGFEEKASLFGEAAAYAYQTYGLTPVFTAVEKHQDPGASQLAARELTVPHYFLNNAGNAGEIIGVLSRMRVVVSMWVTAWPSFRLLRI